MRAIATTLVACAVVATNWPVMAEPFVPSDDAQILERLPVNLIGAGRTAGTLPEARDLSASIELAREYLERAHSQRDPRFRGYAQATLGQWWDLAEAPTEVRLLRAIVKQNRHDFVGSLEDLEAVLRADPRNAQAWLTRAVVLQVGGRYQEAMRSCLRVSTSHPLLAVACWAGSSSLAGEAELSYELLNETLRSGRGTASDRRWALTTLAEIAVRLGRHSDAERIFADVLADGVRESYVLAAFADLLLDLERPNDVRSLLAGEESSDELLLRLAVAERRLGSPRAVELKARLHGRFGEARLRGEGLHLGNEARFELDLDDDPCAALELAETNWRHQQEPVDALLVLRAAEGCGRPERARHVVEWLAVRGTEDVRLTARIASLTGAGP